MRSSSKLSKGGRSRGREPSLPRSSLVSPTMTTLGHFCLTASVPVYSCLFLGTTNVVPEVFNSISLHILLGLVVRKYKTLGSLRKIT
jgi:hypothetical protein